MNRRFTIRTNGPALYEFTDELSGWLDKLSPHYGVITLFVRHTSCSLLIQENADPDVQHDLLSWLDRLAPSADDPAMNWITHRCEGADDMPAHLKAAVLPVSLQIPVIANQMDLGRWQGIYLVEHRRAPQTHEITALFQ